MNKDSFVGLLLMSMMTCVHGQPQDCRDYPYDWIYIGQAPECPQYGLELVLYDEFNGSALDQNVWQIPYPWSTCGNNACHDYIGLPEGNNVVVSNGTCKLITKQEPGYYNNQYFEYTSGNLFSKQSFGYGQYEIRCKIPPSNAMKDMNAAFWAYGKCGEELDVFEFISDNAHRVTMTNHKEQNCIVGPNCLTSDQYYSIGGYANDFHTFSLYWDEYWIAWSIDGDLKHVSYRYLDQNNDPVLCGNILSNTTYKFQWAFPLNTETDKMNIIAGYGTRDQTTVDPNDENFPATMEIDYIKYWKRVRLCDYFDFTVANQTFTPPIYSFKDLRVENILNTSGNVILNNGVNMKWRAGNYINLLPGFEVKAGAEFSATINSCSSGSRYGNHSFSSNDVISSTQSHVILFPNPSNGNLNLKYNTNSDAELFITDITGKKVCSHKLPATETTMNISCEGLMDGVYLYYVVEGEKVIKSDKLVVIK